MSATPGQSVTFSVGGLLNQFADPIQIAAMIPPNARVNEINNQILALFRTSSSSPPNPNPSKSVQLTALILKYM